VTGLTDEYGNLTKTYEYDAFGNEKNKTSDPNPFRYCGEYYDAESGSYYLRARYYNPAVGRFTQEDTHWNTGNMIYGDEPQKIGEYKDPLGVSRYTYAPQTAAIMQAGNLYAYCGGNPLKYVDPTGQEWYHWVIGGVIVAAAAVAVFVTAGGVVPALSAINAVAFGSAAATTVTTVAAGALIGSGTVMTCALITADISSWESFGDSADWTTVAFAAGGFVVGGAYGYKLYQNNPNQTNNKVTIAGKGSTGRVEARNLNEQLAMKQVISNPLEGAKQLKNVVMNDPRWLASDGWVKMSNVVRLNDGTKIDIHFVYNTVTKVFDDFKFKP